MNKKNDKAKEKSKKQTKDTPVWMKNTVEEDLEEAPCTADQVRDILKTIPKFNPNH